MATVDQLKKLEFKINALESNGRDKFEARDSIAKRRKNGGEVSVKMGPHDVYENNALTEELSHFKHALMRSAEIRLDLEGRRLYNEVAAMRHQIEQIVGPFDFEEKEQSE